MTVKSPSDMIDCVVIGGGPAGVAAAINLARACRSVIAIDCADEGRSDTAQVNHNYPGFPEGITAVELSGLGRQQAERFGAKFISGEVQRIAGASPHFRVEWSDRMIHARTILLASGVRDRWPTFPGYREYIGKTMHWCLYCDGYEVQGQRVVVVGNNEDAARLAVQLLTFTDKVSLLTNSTSSGPSPADLHRLDSRGIPVVTGLLTGARAKGHGIFDCIIVDDHEEIAVDHLFSHQGADPNTELAGSLGVDRDAHGYLRVDLHGQTTVQGVYAAGDVTRRFSHQVATAVHEGTTAATAIDSELFEREQAALGAG